MANEQFRQVHMAAENGFVVQRALPIAPLRPRRRVRIRAVRQAPLGELEVVVLDGDVQVPAGAGSVAAHVEHLPLWIGPVLRAAEAARMLVDGLEKPQDLAVEVDVVDDLPVIRLGASIEQQLDERITLRMRGPALFAFTDRADERRVTAVAGHEIRVGIRAVIQERSSDRDGVVRDCLQREAREAEIGGVAPSLSPQSRLTRSPSPPPRCAPSPGSPFARVAQPGRPPAPVDRVEVATDDRGVEVGTRRCRDDDQGAASPCAARERDPIRRARDDRGRRCRGTARRASAGGVAS